MRNNRAPVRAGLEQQLVFCLGPEEAEVLLAKRKTIPIEEWLGMVSEAVASLDRLRDSGAAESARVTTTVISPQ